MFSYRLIGLIVFSKELEKMNNIFCPTEILIEVNKISVK
jgi:hypothetical protein